MRRFIKAIGLQNILSFGPKIQIVKLKPLNILIGPNGAGKSNFIKTIEILQIITEDLVSFLYIHRGMEEWLWKGFEKPPIAKIFMDIGKDLSYSLSFTGFKNRFKIINEHRNNNV